jgi:hypothetical protein
MKKNTPLKVVVWAVIVIGIIWFSYLLAIPITG